MERLATFILAFAMIDGVLFVIGAEVLLVFGDYGSAQVHAWLVQPFDVSALCEGERILTDFVAFFSACTNARGDVMVFDYETNRRTSLYVKMGQWNCW